MVRAGHGLSHRSQQKEDAEGFGNKMEQSIIVHVRNQSALIETSIESKLISQKTVHTLGCNITRTFVQH